MRRFLSRNPRLRTGGLISLLVHLLVILALLITLPNWKPEEEQEQDTTVELIFNGKEKTTIKAPARPPLPPRRRSSRRPRHR